MSQQCHVASGDLPPGLGFPERVREVTLSQLLRLHTTSAFIRTTGSYQEDWHGQAPAQPALPQGSPARQAALHVRAEASPPVGSHSPWAPISGRQTRLQHPALPHIIDLTCRAASPQAFA